MTHHPHKNSHDADAAMLSELPNATSFVTSIFLGRGEYARHESADLVAARTIAGQMAAHYQNGRKALVYAQLPSGRQFLVPDSYNEGDRAMETTDGMTKTFNKRFNAQRAARSALGKDAQEGTHFRTVSTEPGEWTWHPIEKATEPVAAKPAAADRNGGIFGDDPLAPPDFSANTHARFRAKLAAVAAMVETRDIDGLRKFHINPSSTSPKAILRYRDRALAALTH